MTKLETSRLTIRGLPTAFLKLERQTWLELQAGLVSA
jgi:hypothetical protein